MNPRWLISGKAGSGKDTVAGILCNKYNGVAVSLADPMKRLAKYLFEFTDDQLWGPTASRNFIDEKWLKYNEPWDKATDLLDSVWVLDWLNEVLGFADVKESTDRLKALGTWYASLTEICYNARGLSARAVLQTMGTEFGRNLNPLMWIKYANQVQNKLICDGNFKYDRAEGLIEAPGQKYNLAVVTDGRFRNEVLTFKDLGATTLRVKNPAEERDSAATANAGIKGHASEAEQDSIPDWWFDILLRNDKAYGLDHLEKNIDNMMYGGPTRHG